MNQASSAPDPARPDPARTDAAPSRSGVPSSSGSSARRWWLIGIPLLLVVGFGSYELGQRSGTAGGAGSQASGGAFGAGQFGAGQAGAAGGFSGRRSGQTGTRAGGTGATSVGTGSSGAVIAVTASAVKTGTLVTDRTATGTVASTQQTSVSARTSGTVSGLAVAVGDTVRAGQTVVTLSSPDLNTAVQSAQNALDSAQVSLVTQRNQTTGSRAQLQAAVAAAQTTLANAQTTLTANERLYGIGAISQTDLNASRAQVQQAQSSLSSAQNSLNENARAGSEGIASLQLAVQKARITLSQAHQAAADARVTAPFDGQVTAIGVTGGTYVNAGTAAFTLTSSARQVTFNVPPSQSVGLKVGDLLSYTVGQSKYTVKVTQNAGAPVNGNVSLVAKFVDAANVPALGAVGAVAYPFTVASGVLVPSTALQVDSDTTFVYTVVDGKAKQVTVTVLGQANGQAAVNGLQSGAAVIAQPPSGLLDGASVTTAADGARAGSSSTARSDVKAAPAGTGTRSGSGGTPAGGPPAGGPGGAP
ncbi:efflux RND transporter periplasmic adaptor subunit [Deinococcus aquiradiocola]|uniref:Secretion protein HlyD n=1 Tax=Deinococcus aquiradiocola TaxID=393059 RepID=A0A917PBD3_9DEIO|nr:efflux RND transporter periplasmic adaptor subunit [Deinococcus aquiradiocola]GGJ69294.1 hypothetical protein GCM10008939_12100 [Deinococcus aquiradiocola]